MSSYPLYGHSFYSAPSNMAGGYIIYGGYRRQRQQGAGMFGSFRKYMVPVGRNLLSGAKTAGRHLVSGVKAAARNKTVRKIAKKAAKTGAEVLTGATVDALQGRNVGESLKRRAQEALLNEIGGGPPPAKKAKKKLKQRKRRLPQSFTSQSQGPPAAKKRRQRLISRAALNRRELF